jgi:hypothetical protein
VTPPTPPPERDLLATAVRRLPPDVDVVGLVTAPLLAGALALSGCSAADVRAGARDSRSQVIDVSREALARMVAVGRLPAPARGSWRGCADFGGRMAYHVGGRLDPGDEAASLLTGRVTAALAPAGWPLRPVRSRPGDDVVTLEASVDGVTVQVTGYRTEPFVLFEVSGPCLEVGDLDDELRAEAPESVASR